MFTVSRPIVPDWILHSLDDVFIPLPELETFVHETFLNEKSKLVNEDHFHLKKARIGFLLTNIENSRQGKRIVGTAEIPMTRGNKWQKGMADYQNNQWFGGDIDFRIILNAHYMDKCSDIEFCALLEHELYHCSQQIDSYGNPKFSKQTGRPIFGMRGHDVEEFVGIVERYGVEAAAGQSIAFVVAANQKPLFSGAEVSIACGTCMGLKV